MVGFAAQAAVPAPDGAGGYHLGRGYRLASLGVTLGGYANFRYQDLEGEQANFTAQDLSLFVGARLAPTWRLFSESEAGNAVTITSDGVSGRDREFDVERLYLEHDVSTALRLRLGKYLTPVGRWNLVHAAPLVWSVSRPLTTSAPFARHSAGIEALGSLRTGDGGALDYRLFVDDTGDLDPSQRNEDTFMDVNVLPNPRNAFDYAVGGRLVYRTLNDRLQLGFSAADFKLQDRPNNKYLAGADVFYALGGAELTGEAIYRESAGDEDGDDYGGFLQLVLPLYADVYAVASHERYKSGLFDTATTTDRFGLTYRPLPPLSIKLERRETRGEERLAPDGWLLALSVLL